MHSFQLFFAAIYTYTLRVGLDRVDREHAHELALNDSTSSVYKKVEASIQEALDRTLMQSDLRDVYKGVTIARFVQRPVQVEFHVQLSDNTNEDRLKDIFKKYLITTNYSLGGTEVYAARDLDLVIILIPSAILRNSL